VVGREGGVHSVAGWTPAADRADDEDRMPEALAASPSSAGHGEEKKAS